MGALLIAWSPLHAQQAEPIMLTGWWAYDKSCPASDDGFALEPGGRASDGSSTYAGRWSLKEDQVTIVWDADEAERPHLKRGEWRIVETYRLAREPKQRAMLVNTKNKQSAWLCRPNR